MFYMFLAASLGITQDVCTKKYAQTFGEFKNATYLWVGIGSLVSALCRMIISPVIWLPTPMLILAIVQGTLGVVVTIPIVKAMNSGPIVGVNLIMQCVSYLTVVYGVVFYGDEVSVLSVSAAILFLVAMLLLSPPKEEKKQKSAKWFFYAILAGAISALAACVSKAMSAVNNEAYMDGYVFWQQLFLSLVAFVAFFASGAYKQKDMISTLCKEKKSVIPLVLVYGLCGGFVLFSQLKALSTISSLIVYPTLWGCSLITTPFISYFYFHDFKFTLRNIAAVVVGIVATILNTFA